ncbi:MAG TPA: hypothetical protein VKK31_15015 [Thermoanaerobaculia bacterium]|nr:hypothetical protein [Thermoanaerobaculia bacterium]
MTLRALSLLLGGAVALTVTVAALARLFGRRDVGTDPEIRDLVADLVAEILSPKLRRSRLDLVGILTGRHADSELQRKIDAALKSVYLVFERRGKTGAGAEMKIEIRCKDGESQAVAVDRSWDELPDAAREAFLRTGQKVVTLPWRMPWMVQG